jgi:3-hydroxyacyl-[acyl-carrier-protein] dehydratase
VTRSAVAPADKEKRMQNLESVLRSARRTPMVPPATASNALLGPLAIRRMLPHRPPLLLVDSIIQIDLAAETIVAERRVAPSDPVLRGHFPEQPIYPGALVVEALGQASLCLHYLLEKGSSHIDAADNPRPVRLLKIHSASFVRSFAPGDVMTLVARRVAHDGMCMTCAAQALLGTEVAAVAALEVYLPGEAP